MTLDMQRKEIVSSGVSVVRGRPVVVETKRMTEAEVRALNKARLAIIKGVYNHMR